MNESIRHGLAVSLIIAVSVIVYLPAVDNSFISDDFGLFPMLKALDQNPWYIFDAPSELFRVMSYVYFWTCFKLFGMSAEPFYWAGIVLHAIASLLVYLLAWKWTSSLPAALASAVFFAAYERHQEAVMWISAANETVLTLNCLLFLLLWPRPVSLAVFAMALFSKEAAVVLAPLAILSLMLTGAERVQARRGAQARAKRERARSVSATARNLKRSAKPQAMHAASRNGAVIKEGLPAKKRCANRCLF